MKPNPFLSLALVFASALLGCSTAHRDSAATPATKVKLKFISTDSEETDGEDGHGKNAVDGDPGTLWHTQWHNESPGLPHEIILQLLPPSVIKGFYYLPRQDPSDHGTIKDYEFYISDDGENFGQPVQSGVFDSGKGMKTETFAPVKCAFIKLRALSEINHLAWTSAAEIGVILINGDPSQPDHPAKRKPIQPKPVPNLPPNWQARLGGAPTIAGNLDGL